MQAHAQLAAQASPASRRLRIPADPAHAAREAEGGCGAAQGTRVSLPILKLRMIPEKRCIRCSAFGYVDHISLLCAWCLAPGLTIFHRRKSLNLRERLKRNWDEGRKLFDEVTRAGK
jgi:hypothetical protein